MANSSIIYFISDLVSNNYSNSSSIFDDIPYSDNKVRFTLLFLTQPLISYSKVKANLLYNYTSFITLIVLIILIQKSVIVSLSLYEFS